MRYTVLASTPRLQLMNHAYALGVTPLSSRICVGYYTPFFTHMRWELHSFLFTHMRWVLHPFLHAYALGVTSLSSRICVGCYTPFFTHMRWVLHPLLHAYTRWVLRGSLTMFCNLVFQQQLQPLCLLQFFEESPLSLYTFNHPLKPAVCDIRPR